MLDYEELLNEANSFINETYEMAKKAKHLGRRVTPEWSSLNQTEIRIRNSYVGIKKLEDKMEHVIEFFAA